MIAVTFALPAESSDFLRRVGSQSSVVTGNGQVIFGKVAGRDTAMCYTGVGRTQCRSRVEHFLAFVRPNLLISSGFAGSLTDKLQVGDVILAENFSDPELAAKLMGGGAPETPRNASAETGSPSTAGELRVGPPAIRAVQMLTIDTMAHTAEERSAIGEEHQADAADMETSVIAQSCAAGGVRMLSLRVISDSPAAPFPMPPHVLFDVGRQKTNLRQLIPYGMSHPGAAADLFRFARRIRRVRWILADAIIDVLTSDVVRNLITFGANPPGEMRSLF